MAHCTRCYYLYFYKCSYMDSTSMTSLQAAEPVFVNVYGAQESIQRNRFRQSGNRFLGSLKMFKNTGSGIVSAQYMHQLRYAIF